jgi:hypothetical protein
MCGSISFTYTKVPTQYCSGSRVRTEVWDWCKAMQKRYEICNVKYLEWGKREMRIGYWWESQREIDH